MGQVYSNAYANIAATSSSNSSQGLFRERNPTTTWPCIARVRSGHPLIPPGNYALYNGHEWQGHISKAPVSRRAWVHQEWLLSPRTIYFAKDQIFWECLRLKASESFPHGIPRRSDTGSVPFFLRRTDTIHTKKNFLEIWDSIMQEYTSRGLSKRSDKLMAVSALARCISQNHPASGFYLAGIWKNYIIDQLLWAASTSATRSLDCRAPTWSWASIDGAVQANFNWSDISP